MEETYGYHVRKRGIKGMGKGAIDQKEERKSFVRRLNKMADKGRQYQNTGNSLDRYVGAMVSRKSINNLPPVEGALVMCTNATDHNRPVPLVKDDYVQVTLSGLAELCSKDITLGKPFSGCKEAKDKICRVEQETAIKRRWYGLDKSKNSGQEREGLLSEDSYMICMEEYGIISIVHPGQRTCSFIDKLEVFQDHLMEEFGFDQRTVEIIAEMYVRVQEIYWDKSQKERDWYFTRALSQMGGYNNKSFEFLIDIETHAWEYGAGKVYDYNSSEEDRMKFEEKYFCDTLGLEEEEYRYFRQMIRMQHLITSNDEDKYSYETVKEMIDKAEEGSDQEIHNWIDTMERATGKKYSEESADGKKTYIYEEYKSDYEQIHDRTFDKGDFSHMMYTIAANLTNESEGNGVKDHWQNFGAPEMSWENEEERKDIVGWLGDAVYLGEKGVSFGQDDYIADLDADNIVHRMDKEESFLDSINYYYQEMKEVERNEHEFRTLEFLENNPYEQVQEPILARIDSVLFYRIENGQFVVNAQADMSDPENISYMLEKLKNNPNYKETYEFLEKLKTCSEGR